MSDVSNIQNALLSALFAPTPNSQFEAKGLAIYRANLRATALQALRITFPTITQLIGDELLGIAAQKLLRTAPPTEGDWAVWGEGLASVLSDMPTLSDYPFLYQCAQLDYHCHQIVRAKNKALDEHSLLLMQEHDPESLYLTLAPELLVMASSYPIAHIRRAHQLGETQRNAELKTAFAMPNQQHFLACYRKGIDVVVNPIDSLEYKFINQLRSGSLGSALQVINNTEFSFEQWLLHAIQSSLLIGVIYQP